MDKISKKQNIENIWHNKYKNMNKYVQKKNQPHFSLGYSKYTSKQTIGTELIVNVYTKIIMHFKVYSNMPYV